MVNYIVSLYCGKRRAKIKTNFKMLLDKHIEFLSSNPDDIDGFTFVINKSHIEYDQYCIDTINEFIKKSTLKGNLFTREKIMHEYVNFVNIEFYVTFFVYSCICLKR